MANPISRHIPAPNPTRLEHPQVGFSLQVMGDSIYSKQRTLFGVQLSPLAVITLKNPKWNLLAGAHLNFWQGFRENIGQRREWDLGLTGNDFINKQDDKLIDVNNPKENVKSGRQDATSRVYGGIGLFFGFERKIIREIHLGAAISGGLMLVDEGLSRTYKIREGNQLVTRRISWDRNWAVTPYLALDALRFRSNLVESGNNQDRQYRPSLDIIAIAGLLATLVPPKAQIVGNEIGVRFLIGFQGNF